MPSFFLPAITVFLLAITAQSATGTETAVVTGSLSGNLFANGELGPVPSPFLDIEFLIDESGSVSATEFMREKAFATEVAQGLTFGPSEVAAGIIGWTSTARQVINPTPVRQAFLNALNGMSQRLGDSNLLPALDQAETNLNSFGRAGATRVLLVLNEGPVMDAAGTLEAKADSLATQGYHIFPIGVIGGDVDDRFRGLARGEGAFYMTDQGPQVIAHLQSIPEPDSALLMMWMLAGAAARRWRNRRHLWRIERSSSGVAGS